MHKINTDTADENGEFTDGNPQATPPVEPTDLNAAWFNTVQRELINMMALSGASPDPSNDTQLLNVLKCIGLKTRYSEDDVETSSFDGASVIFHSAEDFTIDTLKTDSLVFIIPFWYNSSPDYITVSYGLDSIKIYKYRVFFGIALNGVDEVDLGGVSLPMAFNEGRDLNVRHLTAESVKTSERYETAFVDFENSNVADESGLEPQKAWQLMSEWKLGQVKRVRCTNASNNGTPVFCYGNSYGTYYGVNFYPFTYFEFVCTGSYTLNGVTYATLDVNGKH